MFVRLLCFLETWKELTLGFRGMKKTALLASILSAFAVLLLFLYPKPEPVSVRSAEQTPSPTSDPLPYSKKIPIPNVSATGVYVVDVNSGKVLYEKNASLLVAPASTTKIMTALAAIDGFKLDQVLTVPLAATKVEGQKMHLVAGEKISVESLLYGLLVFSGNDAAETFADDFPGGRNAFMEAMNNKARRLGLVDSTFRNPTGLDESGHLTTAYEMTLLGKYLMDDPRLLAIVGTEKASVFSVELKYKHYLTSTNELLESTQGVLGIKTGWTEEARENLVTYINRGRPVIISMFGSDDRFGDTKKVIDWIYSNFSW